MSEYLPFIGIFVAGLIVGWNVASVLYQMRKKRGLG